ncbi:MAG: leuS [Microbacterium sp.]|nr:leuS [Microbacterium sp.]
MILDLFAPHTAEEMWAQLGYAPSVGLAVWRQPDATLLVEDTITAIVQIDGKVRATLDVSARIDGGELERLARADVRVQRALGDRAITRAIVRPPKVVSFSTT